MKQLNLSKSSFIMKDEPTANNIYDNQINRLLRKPLRQNTLANLSKSAEQLCKKLEKEIMNCITNFHMDDSSDEEDNYEEVNREEIRKQSFKLDDANSAIILELEGRRLMYNKKIRNLYMQKKKHFLQKENLHKSFEIEAKHVITDFLTSIEEAIQNLIDSIKSLIIYQLDENSNKMSNEFFIIILENLMKLFETDQVAYKRWLRMAVRCKKNEILDIPDQIIDVIDKSLTKFVLNFRKTIENQSKRRMEDKKFQAEFFQKTLQELQDAYNDQPIEPFLKQNLGEVFFVSHSVQNFITKKNQMLSFDSVSKRFQEENKFLFDIEHIKKIFLITQNIVYKKLGTEQQVITRSTLPRVYYSQQIGGFQELMAEMHLIRRSVIRSSLNGNQEQVYSLVFDQKNDIVVQIHYTAQKLSTTKIQSRIINFNPDDLQSHFNSLQLQDREFAQIFRTLIQYGFASNPYISHLNLNQLQALAQFLVYFICQLGHQSPSTLVMINMMIDLIEQKAIDIQHLFFQLKHEHQLENWITSQVNDICSRQHIQLNTYSKKILQGDYEEFIQKRAWIVYNWLKIYRKICKQKGLCQDDMLRMGIQEKQMNWFAFKLQG